MNPDPESQWVTDPDPEHWQKLPSCLTPLLAKKLVLYFVIWEGRRFNLKFAIIYYLFLLMNLFETFILIYWLLCGTEEQGFYQTCARDVKKHFSILRKKFLYDWNLILIWKYSRRSGFLQIFCWSCSTYLFQLLY